MLIATRWLSWWWCAIKPDWSSGLKFSRAANGSVAERYESWPLREVPWARGVVGVVDRTRCYSGRSGSSGRWRVPVTETGSLVLQQADQQWLVRRLISDDALPAKRSAEGAVVILARTCTASCSRWYPEWPSQVRARHAAVSDGLYATVIEWRDGRVSDWPRSIFRANRLWRHIPAHLSYCGMFE